MKRKFSFSLPPLKMPQKTEPIKPTPEPTPSKESPSSHRRHHSKDSMLNSPYISRRPLSPRTEQELRSACALILQNFKPSDHDISDESKPRLDTNGMRRKEHGGGTVRVHRPTGAPAEPRGQDPRKHGYATTHADSTHLPMQANTGRRRADHAEDADKVPVARAVAAQSSTFIIPSATAVRELMDAVDDTSLNSPITSSTESHHQHNGSTAPTSAAFTSSRSSKRASRQFENAAAVADAQAAEWMRQELEKRRQNIASQPHPDIPPLSRVPTRSKSIRSEIKEYIFPGSASLSRTASRQMSRKASHETMRSQSSSSKEPNRPGSSSGWRSWGLQRKFSSRSNSRPGSSKGRIESQGHDKKSEIDLNRKLPPLPSLDTWRQPESPTVKDHRKSQLQGAHIATLMRPQDQQQQDYAAAVRRHHRRSGSETMAMKYATSSYSQPTVQIARTASQRKPQVVVTPKRDTMKRSTTAPTLDLALDFDHLMSAMDSTKNFNDQLVLNGHSPERSRDLQSPSMSMKMSSDVGRLEVPPNFSRKISAEFTGSQRDDPNFPNVVQIDKTQKVAQKSKLKKVFSNWMMKKEKKDNWMDQLEKNGIKTGVMVQDEHDAALPPVVRY